MLRTSTTRPLLKSLANASKPRISYNAATAQSLIASHFRSLSSKRPQLVATTFRSSTTHVLRYATDSKPPYDKVDTNAERKSLEKELQPDPKHVSGASSVRQVFEHSPAADRAEDDMLAGIKADVVCILKLHGFCSNVDRKLPGHDQRNVRAPRCS